MNHINQMPDVQEQISSFDDIASLEALCVARARELDESIQGGATGEKQEIYDPIPLERDLPEAKPFPFEALGEVLGGAARRIHEVIQAADAICGQSILAAAALVVQKYADVCIDGRQYPLSLFLITVSESGERKSAADSVALQPIREWEKAMVSCQRQAKKDYTIRKRIWDQEFKKCNTAEADLKKLGQEPQPPLEEIIIIEEPTFQGLTRLLSVGQPSIGLFSDEGGRMLGGHGMQQENVLNTAGGLSNLWDGKPVTIVRKGDGSFILYGKRLSIHLMIQGVVLKQLLKNTLLLGQGLINRCLMVQSGSMAGNRPYKEIDLNQDPAVKRYSDMINSILDRSDSQKLTQENELNPRCLSLTDEAKQLWITFHDLTDQRIRRGAVLHPIRGFASKIAEQALRVGGILTLIDDINAENIGEKHLQRAIILMEYYLQESLRIYGSSICDHNLDLAQQVLDWLKTRDSKLVALATVYRYGPDGVRTAEKARKIMGILVAHHQVTALRDIVVEGKRVKEAYRLND